MKINFDVKKNTDNFKNSIKKTTEKSAETMGEVLSKTGEATNKLATDVQKGLQDFAEKNKQENYLKRLKKYNPLFAETYFSDSFNLPNVIAIVDDAERKDIDVCQGAIGWLNNDNGIEILFMYDEFVPLSGINFSSNVQCDAVYYVDRFDRTRFINVNEIFKNSIVEKIAELKDVAYCIGAKSCSIDIYESSNEKKESKFSFGMKANAKTSVGNVSTSESHESSSINNNIIKVKASGLIKFKDNNNLKSPKLKWFKDNDIIKNLIKMRLENTCTIESDKFEIDGYTSAIMSTKTAKSIDASFSKIAGFKGNIKTESNAVKENSSTFVFYIEF